MTTTPLLLIGDGPTESTGLGRILRDLGSQIADSDLPVELASVGGPAPGIWPVWPHTPLGEAERGDDWGASYLDAVWAARFGRRPGIGWWIWDAARLATSGTLSAPVRRWAYVPIDAANRVGGISGPPAAALAAWDRVIAYGRWASQILRSVRDAVPYLPHGLALDAYRPVDVDEAAWARAELGPHVQQADKVVGCVATNQPRKDFGLFFGALAELAARGHAVYGWLHTDVLVKAWSVQQLVEDCGLAKRVTVSTRAYHDRELAALYQACSVTIAPGLGEGFGYPIVESLASGVPVVHGDFGGGRELVPKIEWRFPVREIRLDGIYALRRPVFRADDVANAVERVWDWQQAVGAATADAYCRGAVAHLGWPALWPRWRAWIQAGL